jgi:predicted SAM-dependent methyltransferase
VGVLLRKPQKGDDLGRENVSEATIKRLHWGCGRIPKPGWINSDRKEGPGIDISCDIREGLSLDTDSIDYVVSIHALEEVAYPDLVPVLEELRRVLKPNGVLRLGLPDLDTTIQAYLKKDRSYFLIPDEEATSLGAKFIVHLIWYGYTRTFFTHDFVEELLLKAGFTEVDRCGYGETHSQYPGIVELDNREEESLFVEAIK